MAGTKIRKVVSALETALKNITLLLILGLALRLLYIYAQYSGDVRNHLAWGDAVLWAGTKFFDIEFQGLNQPNYPSIALYAFGLSKLAYNLSLSIIRGLNDLLPFFPSNLVWLWEELRMQIVFLKLPAIIADLGIGYLIYKLSIRAKFGTWPAVLYLLNPAVFYVSSVWGQIESLTLVFLLLSAYLTQKRLPLSAHFAFVLAVLSKQTALFLLPFYYLWWLKEFGWKKLGFGIGLELAIFFLSFLPLGLTPIKAASWFLSTLGASSEVVSDAAFNLWYWVTSGVTTADSQLLGPFSFRLWSWLLLGMSYTGLMFVQLRDKNVDIFKIFFLSSLAAFFFQTRVHERHLFPALVFLLLCSFPARPKYIGYALLSVYFLANLVWSLKLPFI